MVYNIGYSITTFSNPQNTIQLTGVILTLCRPD